MGDKFYRPNIELLRQRRKIGCRDEIKFILCSEVVFHWAVDMERKHTLHRLANVLFSTVTNLFSPEKPAAMVLAEKLPIRLYLHTLLRPGQKLGI